MKRRPRILICSSGRENTGFGRVAYHMAGELSERYDIHVLGHDVFSPVSVSPWALHPGSPRDVFALERLPVLHGEIRPDITLIINDYWFLDAYIDALNRSTHRGKLAGYVPVDAKLLDPIQAVPLTRLDRVAVYTNFGYQVLTDAMVRLGVDASRMPPIDIIPHGVSLATFRPTGPFDGAVGAKERRLAARRALFGERFNDDGFWVLNANRNSARKRIDVTMMGFALFARGKPPNVRLYLHTGRRDTGPDIHRIARTLGITERLVDMRDDVRHPAVTTERLNTIYNACDVGVNTAVAEGWGLVAFEHAATAAAQILPRHSAFAELWHGSAAFLEPLTTIRFGSFLEGNTAKPEQLAEVLEKVYADPDHLSDLSLAAYRNATRPERSWRRVGMHWDQFFQSLL